MVRSRQQQVEQEIERVKQRLHMETGEGKEEPRGRESFKQKVEAKYVSTGGGVREVSKFPVLTTFSGILRALGWILMVVGALYFLVALMTLKGELGVLKIIAAVITFGFGLGIVVFGELIGVCFAIEHNTFTTVERLRDLEFYYRQQLEGGGAQQES